MIKVKVQIKLQMFLCLQPYYLCNWRLGVTLVEKQDTGVHSINIKPAYPEVKLYLFTAMKIMR